MLCLPTMKSIALLLLALVLSRSPLRPIIRCRDRPNSSPTSSSGSASTARSRPTQGFIHDQHRLSVVYETLHFDADTPPRERERQVDAARGAYQGILRRLAERRRASDPEAQRVRALWGPDASPAAVRAGGRRRALPARPVRPLPRRPGRARAPGRRTSRKCSRTSGLPPEIAALPHVESSFDPTAYSKVGAAGPVAVHRSTGRRFLRIDAAVDERLDPFRETEAAAQLLSYNYRLLGSWPLAITAYNHGAEGMRRAREQLGTDDIVRIVRDYHSPSFGFASRNFYVSFLAALSIAREPDRYFGGFERHAETRVPRGEDAAVGGAHRRWRVRSVWTGTRSELNPALRPPVWGGQRRFRPAMCCACPRTAAHWTPELLARGCVAGTGRGAAWPRSARRHRPTGPAGRGAARACRSPPRCPSRR